MTVLDAGVVIGALRGEPAGAEIVALFARSDPPRLSTAIADCIALATALDLASALATTDGHLARLARAEGVIVESMPNSIGFRA